MDTLNGLSSDSQDYLEQSDLMLNKFGAQRSILESVTGGAIAAVTDFGTSVYNSLPGTEDVTTASVLSNISDNALNVYNENTDLIHTASFIGGMFVPGGLALKGMGMLRAGAKGVSWFSNTGKVENLAKIEQLVRDGAEATKEYRTIRNAILRNGVANNVLDAAVSEALIVSTMNAHPLMEDYMADPAKNFSIGIAFGGVLGGAGGLIADSFALNKTIGAVKTSAFNTVTSELQGITKAMPGLGQLKVSEANIESLAKLADPAYQTDALTKDIASKLLLQEQAAQEKLFNSLVSDDIKLLPPEQKKAIMRNIIGDSRNAGGDSVKFYTITQNELDSLQKVNTSATLSNKFAPEQLKDASGKVLDIEDVVYLPEFNKYSTIKEAANYIRANATSLTSEELNKISTKAFGQTPNVDASLEIFNKSTAYVDSQYLASLKAVDKMSKEEIAKLVIAPDDLYMLNALAARYRKEPELFDEIAITVTKNKPSFESFQSELLKQSKVSPSHLSDLALATAKDSPYNLLNDTSLSEEAIDFLGKWTTGYKADLRNIRQAFDDATRGGILSDDARLAKEVLNSKATKDFKDHLVKSKIASEDGYIYAYRGIIGKTVGHAPIESYTPVRNIADAFGTAKLYKIHLDDIIGTVTSKTLSENEILVAPSAREVAVSLPIESSEQLSKLNAGKNVVAKWGINDIASALDSTKEATISHMLEKGLPLETIAIRTNTPLETVTGFATKLSPGESFADLLVSGDYALHSYGDASKLGEYLGNETKPLRIKSNPNKVRFSELASKLDVQLGFNTNLEYMDLELTTTASSTAKKFYETFFGNGLNPQGMKPMIDMLRSKVAEFNSSMLGNVNIQSADFFLRNTETGRIVTTIGKNLQDVATKSSEILTRPLVDKMSAVAKSELSVIEANTALAVNAGLKGKRLYKDGQFLQEARDDLGNIVWKPAQFEGKDYTIKTPEVRALFETLEASGRELYELKGTINNITGRSPMNDLGFWVPAFNPRDKFIAYVWDKSNEQTKLLWGKTEKELAENIEVFKQTIPTNKASSIQVVTKQEQELYNILNNRLDPLTMEVANVEKFHTGSSQMAIVKANTDIFSEILGGYENYIESHTKRLGEMMMHDIIHVLDNISMYEKTVANSQPLSVVSKLLTSSTKASASNVKNILLSNNNLGTNPFWQQASQNFEAYTTWGINTISSIMKSSIPSSFFKNKGISSETLREADYAIISKELAKKGITNPWAAFDEAAAKVYGVAKIEEVKNSSRRAIYASNAFAASFALRFLDLAQPMVNAMSLPILTHLAKAQDHPVSFMGAKLGTTKVSTGQIMMEGARLNNSAEGRRLAAEWEKLGYFDSYVSEANAVLRDSRKFESGLAPKVENALDSKLAQIIAKPADVTESILRRQTMFTGAVLAKRLYPELDDAGVTIFARDFMDRAIGNYHAPQRPVFFQGTLGVALGLFQTYMLTMGQSVYRHLELKNYKELGKAALLQSSMFGTQSLPGFELVSQAIGDNFSDENYDLTSGTFRAVGDTTATAILYGLPSSLGPAFYTRGDLAPRAVNPFNGGTGFVAGNMIKQSLDSLNTIAQAAQTDAPDLPRAIAQAVSLQSVSRPLARAAELFSGYSVTSKGNTVATPAEIYKFPAIASRLLATRPTEEAKVREVIHLNTVYNQIDSDHRNKVTAELKTAIRSGTLDDSKLSMLALEYMDKGGTPRGWQAAVNKALAETNTSGREQLINKLKPDSPLMYMIDGLDG